MSRKELKIEDEGFIRSERSIIDALSSLSLSFM